MHPKLEGIYHEGGQGSLDDSRGRAGEDAVRHKGKERRWIHKCSYLRVAVDFWARPCITRHRSLSTLLGTQQEHAASVGLFADMH